MKSFPTIPVLAVVSAIGLGISVYMGWVGLTGSSVVGCDGSMFNCDHVLTSRWSKVFGVPVGLPAAALYATLLALVAFVGWDASSAPTVIWRWISLLSWTAGLAALWFLGLQIFVLGHLCVYCVAAHTCSLLVWALVQFTRPWDTSMQKKNAFIGLVLVAILVGGQALGTPPQTFRIEEHSVTETESATSGAMTDEAVEVFGAPTDQSDVDVFDAPVMEAPLFDAPIFETPDFESSDGEAADPLEQSSRSPSSSLNVALGIASLFGSPSMGWVGVLDDATATSGEQTDPNATDAANEPASERRLVPVSAGRRQLDIDQWPLWGDRDAKYVIAKMFDYTCSHCRETHHAIVDAAKQLDGGLAVVALPTPLHQSCNSASKTTDPSLAGRCTIAKLGVTMWLAAPDRFSEFHDWMFQQERTVDETRNHIIGLVGTDRFNKIDNSKTPSAYVDKNVFLYKESGAGTLPKLVFPTTTVVGEISSGNTLANLIREKL
jgi:uncharacterized membrane protein/protein-disulfide isomerase